jgi:hypothetical protein
MQASLARQKGSIVMAATNRIAPPAIIARAGGRLLDQLAARPVADPDAAARAVGRAIERLIAGARFHRDGATVTFQSWSRPGEQLEHTAGPKECSCEAGQEGRPCWHRAARCLIIRLELEQDCAAAEAAELAGELLPAPRYCSHCHHDMLASATPAGEACYQCSNPRCQCTRMASLFASPQDDQATPQPAQERHQQAA